MVWGPQVKHLRHFSWRTWTCFSTSILTIRESFDCACLYLLPSRSTFSQGLSICSQYSQTGSQCSCRSQRCDCTIKTKACIVNLWFMYVCTSVLESLCSWLCLNDSKEFRSTHYLLIYGLIVLMWFTSRIECITPLSLSRVILHTMRLVHSHCSSCVSRMIAFSSVKTKPCFSFAHGL